MVNGGVIGAVLIIAIILGILLGLWAVKQKMKIKKNIQNKAKKEVEDASKINRVSNANEEKDASSYSKLQQEIEQLRNSLKESNAIKAPSEDGRDGGDRTGRGYGGISPEHGLRESGGGRGNEFGEYQPRVIVIGPTDRSGDKGITRQDPDPRPEIIPSEPREQSSIPSRVVEKSRVSEYPIESVKQVSSRPNRDIEKRNKRHRFNPIWI